MGTEPLQPIDQYYFGGTLRVDATTYVTRQADRDLYEGLKVGDFCYLLNSRQMGKSSLAVRTMTRLKAEDIACAFIDITEIIDQNITEEKWYAGLIKALLRQFDIGANFDLRNWLRERDFLSSVQRFSEFIETVVLAIPDRKFVIFLDEIDSIIELGSIANSFFAYIRSCWNERAINSEYNRLTFAVLGVAAPSDLMQDRQRTPFNIGRTIDLTGFSFEEAKPLATGLAAKTKNPLAVLEEIWNWTNGQPFLTQKICQSIAELESPIAAGSEREIVDLAIYSTHASKNWATYDHPEHLASIRNRLLSENNKPRIGMLLGIYQQILLNAGINADNSPEQMELRLAGLVVKSDNQLRVYNRLYAEVFDLNWIALKLTELRPSFYIEAFRTWQTAAANHKESSLLLGQQLRDAETWARGKQLSLEDTQFINASQDLERREETERRIEIEYSLAKTRQQVAEFQAQGQQANQQLAITNRRTKIASGILSAMTIAVVGAGFWLKNSSDNLDLATMKLTITESKADLGKNLGLEAMLQGIKVGRKLEKLDGSVGTKEDRFQALQSLQRANSQVLERNRLQGHNDWVYAVAFSPNGQRIASSSADETIQIWDAQTGIQIGKPLLGHTDEVRSVAFSPDGQRIISGSKDKTVRLWDTQTGIQIGSPLEGHRDGVASVKFSPDGQRIISGSLDKTVRIWDVNTGIQIGSPLEGHTAEVNSVAFSPDGQRIVSGSFDKTVRLWDVNTGKPISSPLKGHEAIISSVAFSPDGQSIASSSMDKTVRLWNTKTGKLIRTLKHDAVVWTVSFSPDSKSIVTGSADKTVRRWDVNTGDPIGNPLLGHTEDISAVVFSPDGQHIASSSMDKTVRLWDAKNETPIDKLFAGHTAVVKSVAFSPDGQQIVSGSMDKTVRLWNAKNGKPVGNPLTGHTKGVTSVAFSPDGQHIVSGSTDKTMRLWNAKNGKPVGDPLTGHTDEVWAVAFSPDGQYIVSGSTDKTVRLWNTKNGKPVSNPLTGHTSWVTSVAFSPDGQRLASGSKDRTMHLWNAENGKPIGNPLQGHTDRIWAVAFSPDGQHIVTGSEDKVWLWDAKTGAPIGKLTQGHESLISSVAFSPDGKSIVSGSFDNTVRIWDAKTGAPIGKLLQGHKGGVTSVAFSPDGKSIVSGSFDNTVRIWDRLFDRDSDIDRLLTLSCNKLHDYLANNPNVSDNDRALCDIPPKK
jgi:WD40 repeat protein